MTDSGADVDLDPDAETDADLPTDFIHVGGHRVERLPPTDAYVYCCVDCAGHADEIDVYRADDCDQGGDR